MDKLPIVGETYNCYDDGKICESRRYPVVITDIVPFSEAPQNILDEWNKQKENCSWLYAEETDYFILANSYEQKKATQQIFARTISGHWFGLGTFLNSGLLVIK